MTHMMIASHDYVCDCERCKRIWGVLLAQLPNGDYFFSDEEIEALIREEAEP